MGLKAIIGVICLAAGLVSQAQADIVVQEFPGKLKVIVDLGLEAEPLKNAVDILFVVDNSGSMSLYQKDLSDRVPLLIDELYKSGVDFHAGVITTDDLDSVNGQGRLYAGYVDSNSPDGRARLSQMLLPGIRGSGTEMVFDPILKALSEPNLSTVNSGFYRPQAKLAIVFLTDADDQSQNTTASGMIDFLKVLKGDLSNVLVEGFFIQSTETKCARGSEPVATRIEDFMKQAAPNSYSYSLCSGTMTADVLELAEHLVELAGANGKPTKVVPKVNRIPLPMIPEYSTLTVNYGSQAIRQGDLQAGWVYNSATNEVLLGSKINWSVQPKGTMLEIDYVPEEWMK